MQLLLLKVRMKQSLQKKTYLIKSTTPPPQARSEQKIGNKQKALDTVDERQNDQKSHVRISSFNVHPSDGNQKNLRNYLLKFTTSTAPSVMVQEAPPLNMGDQIDATEHQQYVIALGGVPSQVEEDICDDEESKSPFLTNGIKRIQNFNLLSTRSTPQTTKRTVMFSSKTPTTSSHEVLSVKKEPEYSATRTVEKTNVKISQSKIQLIVRIRPFLESEQKSECIQRLNDDKGIRLFQDYHQIHFKFDTILKSNDGQAVVFSKIQSIIHSSLLGVNGTIFAYGQTGAGKTYSIIGNTGKQRRLNNQDEGILPRTLQYLFKSNLDKIQLSVSFFEIYNEKIYDLLEYESKSKKLSVRKMRSLSRGDSGHGCFGPIGSVKESMRTFLELREDADGQFMIQDLQRVQIKSLAEATQLMNKGLTQRATSSTSLNTQSSRSHSVFQIYIEKELESGMVIKSKLRIVDLAGSEKYSIRKDLPHSEKVQKVQELTSINSSLSALGLCISALSSDQQSQNVKQPRKTHIPYRNSKLTRVLKDSLEETSNVALIICISPSISNYKETLSTLQFADRAKRAILDGRQFSQIKQENNLATGDQQTNSAISLFTQQQFPSSMSASSQPDQMVGNILRAYEEEKAIRLGLQQYQHEVIEELENLKKQNQLLQHQVTELSSNKEKIPKNSSMKNGQSWSEGEEVISINIIPMGKFKRNSKNKQKNGRKRILSVVSKPDDDCVTPVKEITVNQEHAQTPMKQVKPEKRVRFAEKLDNDQSLDSSMRERIEHNLKYNDDTIFDALSIFHNVNSSGIVHKKIVAEKERHPSHMKNKMLIEEDDDGSNEMVQIQNQEEEAKVQQLRGAMDPTSREDQSGGGQEFWLMMSGEEAIPKVENQRNILPQLLSNQFSYIQDDGNKSNDYSRDMIEIGNFENRKDSLKIDFQDSFLQSRDEAMTHANDIFNPGFQMNVQDKVCDEILHEDQNMEDESQGYKLKLIDQSQIPYIEQTNQNQCDQSEVNDHMIFEDFGEIPAKTDDFIDDSSILILEDGRRQVFGINEDGQNTLILDSQSMDDEIHIENPKEIEKEMRRNEGHQNSLNLSSRMRSLDASSIMMIQDESNVREDLQRDTNQVFQNVFQLPLNLPSRTSSQGNHEDVLTFTLTNTFSTLESMKDDLSALRSAALTATYRGSTLPPLIPFDQGLNSSNRQAKQPNIMKIIHKYAREIEDDGRLISIQDLDEADRSGNLIHTFRQSLASEGANLGNDNQELFSSKQINEENNKFMVGIRGFYSKIHTEIAQLKSILIDTQEKSPEKQPSRRNSSVSIENIDKAQDLIVQLKSEMIKALLPSQEHTHSNSATKVLRLLDQLQNSLMPPLLTPRSFESISPVKSTLNDSEIHNAQDSKEQNCFLAPGHQRIEEEEKQGDLDVVSRLDPQTIIRYEQMPSAQMSQASPHSTMYPLNTQSTHLNFYPPFEREGIHSRISSYQDDNNHYSFQMNPVEFSEGKSALQQQKHHVRQNTPDLFKGLSNILDTSQNQERINDHSSIMMHQPKRVSDSDSELLVTLKSYNKHAALKKRTSFTDNTLTLIFDSSEEDSQQEANYDMKGSDSIEHMQKQHEQQFQQQCFVDEGEFGLDAEQNNSFADTSQIRSDFDQGISKHQNVINQESFQQADSSLLNLANDIVVRDDHLDLSKIQSNTSRERMYPTHNIFPSGAHSSQDRAKRDVNQSHSVSEMMEASLKPNASKTSVHKYWNKYFNFPTNERSGITKSDNSGRS